MIKRAFGRLGMCLLMLCLFTTAARAQVLFTKDSSGNLTSALTTSSSTNATPSSAPQGIKTGDELSLTIKVTGVIPTSYQWRLNGTNISGATNAMYYVAEAQATNAGAYSVVASYSGGSVTSVVGNVSVWATTEDLKAIAYGGGKYIAVGNNGTAVSSTDLVSWSLLSTGTTNNLAGIIYDGAKFLVVGGSGTILTSPDGQTWSSQTSGTSNRLNSITSSGSRYVAAGEKGLTISSLNGTNWTAHTSDFSDLLAITYGNSTYVTVGQNGTIWASADGTNWDSYAYSTNLALNAVSYNTAGFFVASGDSGLILTSTNAHTWSVRKSANIRNYQAAVLHNSSSIILGPEGKAYASANGSTWNSIATGTSEVLNGAVSTGSALVAVGNKGVIVSIPVSVVDHYEFASITSPQRAGQSFSVSVTAKDATGATVSGADGSLTLTAESQGAGSNVIIGNQTPEYSIDGGTNVTILGYAFTPAKDLEVTHFRHYYGSKITLWDMGQVRLAEMTITNSPGSWIETSLDAPLTLKAGQTYLLTVTATGYYYYRGDLLKTFTDGTIDQGFGDFSSNFPQQPTYTETFLVDLRYTAARSASTSVSPSSLMLSSGTASGSITVSSSASAVVLRVTDSNGKTGTSAPILVQSSDDIALTMTASASQVAVFNYVNFASTIYNAGPGSSTGVYVTNAIPAGTVFVTASSSQGTWLTNASGVVFNVGTISSQATATVGVTLTSTNGSLLVTNMANVVRTEAETVTTNNTASARTYFAPFIFISAQFSYSFPEGNVGAVAQPVIVLLSSPSKLGITFNYSTQAGTATPGSDYEDISGVAYIPPGSSGTVIGVNILGDTTVESNETFTVNIYNPTNAFTLNTSTTMTITNDDGFSGRIHSLVWDQVFSPKRAGYPFSVTLTAKDYFNSTVTGFTNTVDLLAVNIGSTNSQRLLSFTNHTRANDSGLCTYGYDFTPTNSIILTHLLSYSGTKVSLWNTSGKLLAVSTATSTLGEWTTNQVYPPLILQSSNTYRLSFYSGGQPYFSRPDRPVGFPDGKIGGSYYSLGDAFPQNSDSTLLQFVDLLYVKPAALSPSVSGNFTAGVWTGNLTINEPGDNFLLMADDRDGHKGNSSRFTIYPTNDFAVLLQTSTTTPQVGSNLVYSILALNPGPSSSTGVFITNTLPPNASLVSITLSQGTYVQTNGMVICDVGTIGNLSGVALTITVKPTEAGTSITNSVSITRNESDANLANNQASIVLWPSLSVSQQLAEATDSNGMIWTSSENQLWLLQTNIFHSGGSAAQTGPILHNQFSSLQTIVRGPGVLSFWWKVSSEINGDVLAFYTNSTLHSYISGEVDWQQVTVNVPPGLFTNIWRYSKNGSINSGADAGWIDNVVFTAPTVTLTSVTNTTNGFKFSVTGTNGHRLIVQGTEDFFIWKPIVTNTISGTNFQFTDANSTNYQYRFYRTFHSHTP